MTIYFKSRVSGGLTVLFWKILQIQKSDVLPWHGSRIRFQWVKLFIFKHFMYLSLEWHNTEAPWPFISKVVGAQAWQFCFEKYSKFKNVTFYHGMVTKYVVSGVHCLYLNTLCIYHKHGITQKPHDHLFQKLWARKYDSFDLKSTPNSKKWRLPWHRNQIRCQYGILFIFKHFMYLSI